jgi:hypothetical protein
MIAERHCKGCRNDFYNGRENFGGGTRCWSAEKGTMVKRYRLHWHTPPTQKGAFTAVTVPSCYHQPGQYAYQEKLPDFVKASDVVRSKRAAAR